MSGIGGVDPALRGAPVVLAADPGQLRLEGAEHVEEGPGDDDDVVGGEEERDHHCGQPSA